jgi:uncharacterized UPF0160 family protein
MKTLVTHSETFHCDEVMATAILQIIYPDIKIIRTRDSATIEAAKRDPTTCLIDVGQVYDPANLCFDHHQKSFTETCSDSHNIPLSSCGLIYRHYGRELVRIIADSITGGVGPNAGASVDLEYIYLEFYNKFIYSIDAGDNGVDYAVIKRYQPIVLPVTISLMNHYNVHDSNMQDSCFMMAVKMCREHLLIHLLKCINRSIDYNKDIIVFEQGLAETPQYIKNSGVLILSKAINVRLYLKRYDKRQFYKYIVAPRDRSTWNIWTVPIAGTKFETLAPLITQEEAMKKYDRHNVIFIHKNLFCGVTTNQETAIEIALDSAKQYEYRLKFKYGLRLLCALGLGGGALWWWDSRS